MKKNKWVWVVSILKTECCGVFDSKEKAYNAAVKLTHCKIEYAQSWECYKDIDSGYWEINTDNSRTIIIEMFIVNNLESH